MQELSEVAAVSFGTYQPVFRDILQYPHPMLSRVSAPVTSDIKNDQHLQNLLADMVVTMVASKAVGLAGVQVGEPIRVLVVRSGDKIVKAINPRVVKVSRRMERYREGCLSFVGLFVNVWRPKSCVVEYYDENGVLCSTEADDLLGRTIQHEMDHLDGKTFLDRLSNVERSAALQKNRIAKRRVKAMIRQENRQ